MQTRARRRMDKLIRHLTDASAAEPLANTPQRARKIRRQLASAQKERVLNEYGYELKDETNDVMIQLYDDSDKIGRDPRERKQIKLSSETISWLSKNNEDDIVIAVRDKLSKACLLGLKLGVFGFNSNDTISTFVEGVGYIFKPLGLGFDEVTPERLGFTKSIQELPALHAELHKINCINGFTVVSACNENCELVSIFREGLLPMSQDSLRIYGNIRKVDEKSLPDRAVRVNYKGVNCWLVKQRGTICCGKSIEIAFANITYTIRACSFQVRALSAVGGDINRLDILTESEAIKAKIELNTRCDEETAAQNLFQIVHNIL